MIPRIVIPSELQDRVREPGTYAIEGRMAIDSEPPYAVTIHVEKITPADPPETRRLVRSPNLHDHAHSTDPKHNPSAYGRHDHPPPPWGDAHRHINSLRSAPVPPTVVGCTNVAHNKVDCFAAGLEPVHRCPKCQAAVGRKFRR